MMASIVIFYDDDFFQLSNYYLESSITESICVATIPIFTKVTAWRDKQTDKGIFIFKIL